MKAETHIMGPWEFGKMSQQGDRNDLTAYKAELCSEKKLTDLTEDFGTMMIRYPHGTKFVREVYQRGITKNVRRLDLQVIVLIGETRSGKTRYVYDTEGMENVYPISTYGDKIWFDGYDGEKVLLLDDFYGGIKYGILLNLLDIYPLRLDIKGCSTWARWEKVYITSNAHPRMWYKNLENTKALFARFTKIYNVLQGGILKELFIGPESEVAGNTEPPPPDLNPWDLGPIST